jgi:hypothetical protein
MKFTCDFLTFLTQKILWQTFFLWMQKTQQQKLPFLPLGVQQHILGLMIRKVLRQTLLPLMQTVPQQKVPCDSLYVG